MGLTGIEIFKKLPKTNCKECGFMTCLAFSMQVAAGKIEITKCPHLEDKIKEELAEESLPPVRPVSFGEGSNIVKIGEETVAFRHEKKFVNPPVVALLIKDNQEDRWQSLIKEFKTIEFERVGIKLRPEALFLELEDKTQTENLISLINKELPNTPIIISSHNLEILSASISKFQDRKPLIHPVSEDNISDIINILKDYKGSSVIPVVSAELDKIPHLTKTLLSENIKEIVIEPRSNNIKELFQNHVILRKLSISGNKPYGFPTIALCYKFTEDTDIEILLAATLVAKYAGIIVISTIERHYLFPLLIQRLNIYSDPQKPLTVKEDVYKINNPDDTSSVLITTNFSLTYFTVSSEVEASKKPAWLCVINTDGLSVLTAWAAGKFSSDGIANYIKKFRIEEIVKHKSLVIPGYVAMMKGELEEELNYSWNVVVGPREASDIPVFLQNYNPIKV